jgi:hypothetical protein
MATRTGNLPRRAQSAHDPGLAAAFLGVIVLLLSVATISLVGARGRSNPAAAGAGPPPPPPPHHRRRTDGSAGSGGGTRRAGGAGDRHDRGAHRDRGPDRGTADADASPRGGTVVAPTGRAINRARCQHQRRRGLPSTYAPSGGQVGGLAGSHRPRAPRSARDRRRSVLAPGAGPARPRRLGARPIRAASLGSASQELLAHRPTAGPPARGRPVHLRPGRAGPSGSRPDRPGRVD